MQRNKPTKQDQRKLIEYISKLEDNNNISILSGTIDYRIADGQVHINSTGKRTDIVYKWIERLKPSVIDIVHEYGTTHFTLKKSQKAIDLVSVCKTKRYFLIA